MAAHKSTDVASRLKVLPMDGELGAPCLGAPLGTQAQQDGVLGEKAGEGSDGSPAWHFLTSVPAPKALGQRLSSVSWAIAGSPVPGFCSPTTLLSATLPCQWDSSLLLCLFPAGGPHPLPQLAPPRRPEC